MINFILGPNGVGKSKLLQYLDNKLTSILLETNQKIDDISSDTSNSFLIQIVNIIYKKNIDDISSKIHESLDEQKMKFENIKLNNNESSDGTIFLIQKNL